MNGYAIAAVVGAINIPNTLWALGAFKNSREAKRRLGPTRPLAHNGTHRRRMEDKIEGVPLNTAMAIIHSQVLELQEDFTSRMNAQDQKIESLERRVGK